MSGQVEQLNAVPLPEQAHEEVVLEQRALLAAQLYAVPEPEQTSQSPVHKLVLATQLPELQTSQLPVQSESTSIHTPIEPATLHLRQLPLQFSILVSQQTPLTQNPEAQSIALAHSIPSALLPVIPLQTVLVYVCIWS